VSERDDLIADMNTAVRAGNAAWLALASFLANETPPPPPDTTAPVITVPPNITVTAPAGATGMIVTFPDPVTDDPSAVEHVTPASGSTFPIGVTTVQVSAVDPAGNRSTATFTVTVLAADVTPPPPGRWPTHDEVGIPKGAWTKGDYSPPAYNGGVRSDGIPVTLSPSRPDLKLTRVTSTLTVTKDGTIVEGCLFEAGLNIRANGVVVRNCLFRGGSAAANTMIVVGTNGQTSPFTRPEVHHCEFDMGNNGDVNPIGDNAYWMHHCWSHRGHGAWINGDTLIEDCIFDDLVINAFNTNTPSHLDGAQHGISRNPARPWNVLRRCVIDNPGNQTSCVAHFATWETPPHSLLLDGNYFLSSTGRLNIAIYAGLLNSYDVRIVGNTFGHRWTNYNGTAKRVPTIDHGEMFASKTQPGLWWHANVFDDDGSPVHAEWDRPAPNPGGKPAPT
jgi:hypothetical protein